MEIIIVVAIIAILVGLSTVSIGILTSGNIKGFSTKINSTLETVRVQDMSYTNKPSLYFYQDSGGSYRMFVSSDPSVSLTSAEATGAQSLGNLKLTLTFKKSSGATQDITDLTGHLYQVSFNSNSGELKETLLSTGDKGFLTNIRIQESNGNQAKDIFIVPGTGKHGMND